MSTLGLNRQDIQSGLQSLYQPDNSSAINNSSLLKGIDQL